MSKHNYASNNKKADASERTRLSLGVPPNFRFLKPDSDGLVIGLIVDVPVAVDDPVPNPEIEGMRATVGRGVACDRGVPSRGWHIC